MADALTVAATFRTMILAACGVSVVVFIAITTFYLARKGVNEASV